MAMTKPPPPPPKKTRQICMVCKDPRRAEIERCLILGTSVRAVEAQFGLNKTSVNLHARAHLKKQEILQKVVDAVRLDTAEDVLEAYKWAYNENLNLYATAKSSYDTRLQDKCLGNAAAILDRFARSYNMFAPESIVNIDNSTRKIELVINSMSDDELRNYIAGLSVPALTAEAIETQSEPEPEPEEPEVLEERSETLEQAFIEVVDAGDVEIPSSTSIVSEPTSFGDEDEWESQDEEPLAESGQG